MIIRASLVGLLFATSSIAQAVLPPFNSSCQFANLGSVPAAFSYGGTAFLPGNPNVLVFAVYGSTAVMAVPLVRAPSGNVVSFGTATPVATVGGTDGGLAFGPTGVLFATWFGPNRLSQIKPGSASADRVDDLSPLGVSLSVGTCAFVPPGLPGAGRFKLISWNTSQCHDLPLTPDGNGTFAPGNAGVGVQLSGGPEAMVYVPASAPLFAGKLVVGEWGSGDIAVYDIDAIGDPIPATRVVVAGGAYAVGGGAVDPVTGDIFFLNGYGQLIALRDGAACGTFTGYGPASPGALGTPTISGAGCVRLGQTITISTTGPINGLGILATGYEIIVPYLNLTVLQSLDATVISVLDATGHGSQSIAIPANPWFGYQHLYFQAAYLDASTTSGLIASAGLDILIR